MTDFNFPRDSNSNFNHITGEAVEDAVRHLLEGLEEAFFNDDLNIKVWLRGEQGVGITELLKVGAACAFLKKLDPDTDYDAALVHQALGERLRVNRGINPDVQTRFPPETDTSSPS